MKKKYIYILLFSSVTSLMTCFAQEGKIKNADKDFNQYNYINARKAYLKVVENGYASQDIYEKIGDSYYFNAELEKASKWYAKLYYEYKNKIDPEYLFRYSQSLKNIGQYENADTVMNDFRKATGTEDRRSKLFLSKPDYLELIKLQSGKFDIVNLPINSPESDFGPSFMKDDQIVFASSRGGGVSKVVHEWTKANFLDLYATKRESKNTMAVTGVSEIRGDVNTSLHESSSVFTNDGNTVYFTRNNFTNRKRKGDESGTTLLKLYKATKNEKGKWTDVLELPFNSNEFSTAHPALSVDEKTLYFASDRPGTTGLSDLYSVNILGNNQYSEPKNLGKNINTEARETFPFISKEGKLFFASDGHPGLGGLDVFVTSSSSNGRVFKEPYNIGEPINSPYDDFTFIIDSDTKIGYFTSNRTGGIGDDDIYSFIQTKKLIESCNQYLSGIVTDAETREVLPGAEVLLLNSKMEKIESTTADSQGRYSLSVVCNEEYVIRAAKATYRKTEVDFFTDNIFEFKHNQPIQLRKGEKELGIITAKIGDDLGKLLQLNPIYFDFDKSYIRPDAEIELQKVIAVLKEYPNMEIDVRSHTDSRAPYNYNIALSKRRNKETLKYIIERGGISVSRLTGKGYGETQLTNGCADGIDCSEEEHQLNRRSEFIITKQ